MAFRLVQSGGHVADPVVFNVYASGTIQRNSVVEVLRTGTGPTAFTPVSQAGATSTGTSIFGVSLDYVQGNSDTFVKVIPFQQGQVWEADCVNAIATLQIFKRHELYAGGLLVNNTSSDNTASVGVFYVWNVDGLTTGSGKVLGEFISSHGDPLRQSIL